MTGLDLDPATGLPLRPELRGIEPYGAPQLDVPVRLNVNENPFPPSPALVADAATAVAHVVAGLNRYPDRDAVALRTGLAAFLSKESGVPVTTEQVWAANGSNEVMQQLLQAFGGPGRSALSFTPTYSMYPEYARDTSTSWHTAPRAEDYTLDLDAAATAIAEHRPSVVFLASPNNPTGTAVELDQVAALHELASGAVLVVDEAYAEFRRTGTPSALELLATCPRLVVTRTMSKAFAFAGARLGYAAAAPAIVEALRVVRLPYHLSAVTQAVAGVALEHADELLHRVDQLRHGRDELAQWLQEQGLHVAASDANFVLFGVFPDRHAVWESLLERGVLIRETGPAGHLRVSIGTTQEMTAFKDALMEVLNR